MQTLDKIRPLHVVPVPPKNATIFGQTADGQVIYELITKRSGSEPKLDENGKQDWRKHATTGEQIIKLRQPTFFEKRELFVLESMGNGNVCKTPYHPPDPKEIERARRRQAAQSTLSDLTEFMVDEGITAADLIAGIRGQSTAPPLPTDVPPLPEPETEDRLEAEDNEKEAGDEEPEVEYPHALPGVARWALSDGSEFKGKKKDAIEAETEVASQAARAKADQDAVPEI